MRARDCDAMSQSRNSAEKPAGRGGFCPSKLALASLEQNVAAGMNDAGRTVHAVRRALHDKYTANDDGRLPGGSPLRRVCASKAGR